MTLSTPATRGRAREEFLRAEIERLRQALIPFAFIGRGSMADLGLGAEYDHARSLLGLTDDDKTRRVTL